jgi:HEAT repeat protein
MMEALKAPEPETRARVGLALCLNGDKDLDIGLLIPLLTDKDGKPRPDIALAIGITQAGNPKAVETLIAALDGGDAKTKEAVASALKTLTHQDIGPDPAKWRKWWAENKKKFMEDAAEMEKFFKE